VLALESAGDSLEWVYGRTVLLIVAAARASSIAVREKCPARAVSDREAVANCWARKICSSSGEIEWSIWSRASDSEIGRGVSSDCSLEGSCGGVVATSVGVCWLWWLNGSGIGVARKCEGELESMSSCPESCQGSGSFEV